MFSIRLNGNTWEVLDAEGNVVATRDSQALALDYLGELLTLAVGTTAALTAPEGALPARWRSYHNGEALQAETGDGRDFSECEYSYLEGPRPLMLKVTDGHGNFDSGLSYLAGWSDMNEIRDGVPYAEGWFHDNEWGREFVRILTAQARYGVSVDPGAMPDYEWECVEQDEDGFCVAESTKFLTYPIGGRTGVPFQAFADAWIELDPAYANAGEIEESSTDASERKEGVSASGTAAPVLAPRREPRSDYLTMPEPPDDDPRYVPQIGRGVADGEIAIPLTISPEPDEDGWFHLYGHYYVNGACHIGYPNECITPPGSPTNCANFNQFVQYDSDGHAHPVGNLVLGLDHADLALSTQRARDHYAHTGYKWAAVHASEGRHGGWVTGVVMPEFAADANRMRVLRASGLSGDWRWLDEHSDTLDVFAIQSVNVPGFPVTRQIAAAAGIELANPTKRVVRRDGKIAAMSGVGIVSRGESELRGLVASGTVRCPRCDDDGVLRLARSGNVRHNGTVRDTRLDRIESALSTLLNRTRHLAEPERDHLARSLRV